MLKWLKRLVFFVFCLALLGGAVYAGGYLLPENAHLERTHSVDAEAEHVYRVFNTVDGLTDLWVTSGKRAFPDFTAKHTGGPAEGVGLELAFTAQGRSMGTMTITESTPNQRVVYAIDYGTLPVLDTPLTLTRTIDLDAVGPLTTVTWTEDAKLTVPPLRYMALLSENTVENEIGAALADVGRAAEETAKAARADAAAAAKAAKAEAAAKAAEEEAKRLAEKEKADAEWEYTQEEAPTPIAYEEIKTDGD